MDAPIEPLSLRAYARHRGVSHEAVRKAIETGRLAVSITRVDGQPQICDAELADLEWEENTRSATPAGGTSPLTAARIRREEVKAELAELDLAKRRGELVSLQEVRSSVEKKFAAVRTRLLAVPSRARQRLPHLRTEDICELEELVREALEELAAGNGGADGG